MITILNWSRVTLQKNCKILDLFLSRKSKKLNIKQRVKWFQDAISIYFFYAFLSNIFVFKTSKQVVLILSTKIRKYCHYFKKWSSDSYNPERILDLRGFFCIHLCLYKKFKGLHLIFIVDNFFKSSCVWLDEIKNNH